ncbi:hypothetical protein [Massilia sp. CF038]|uniref:hypothetical protein n=1 Tax=Massilia sp. CF038 TaxID=1881045 RepID=UPI00091F554D|nr:hypothetical protein [Massilia sp. CF038]SHH56143.1 hypothetical protein SAMN05428948_4470 [Massilia sp. CF038]
MNTRLFLAALAFVITGCATAPQVPVALTPKALATPGTRVAIAMTELPKINTFFPGASCLLCMAAAELNHTAMTAHVQKLTYEELPKLNAQLAAVMTKKGHQPRLVNINLEALPDFKTDAPNFARKDFRGLKQSMGVEKIVVIQVTMVGIERMYSTYIPVAEPKAVVKGQSFMVNLTDNSLEWYTPIDIQKASDGNWDEAPAFPGLTNAYFQTLEMTKDQVLVPFSN